MISSAVATKWRIPLPSQSDVQRILTIQKARRVVVVIALALLLFSMVQRDIPALAFARSGFWALAGLLSIAQGYFLHKAGQKAVSAWLNAAFYLFIAALPLIAWR